MRLPRVAVGCAVAMVLLLAPTGCGTTTTPESADEFAPESGGRLPDVTLDALAGGDRLDLGGLKGPVVVNLWASWCGPCADELPRYEEFARAHEDVVDVVGIDTNETSVPGAEQLLRRTGVTYPNYADTDDALRAIALPRVVLLDAQGEIAFAQYLEIDSVAQLEDLVREHLGVAL